MKVIFFTACWRRCEHLALALLCVPPMMIGQRLLRARSLQRQ
jgi:hypothetical protein